MDYQFAAATGDQYWPTQQASNVAVPRRTRQWHENLRSSTRLTNIDVSFLGPRDIHSEGMQGLEENGGSGY
jgi:hypothetical protein